AQGLCQHSQIYPDGRQLELWKHVQLARREPLVALFADVADQDSDQQPALRFLTSADPNGRGRSRASREAPSVVDERDRQIHYLHRAMQFGFRLYNLSDYVVLYLVQQFGA